MKVLNVATEYTNSIRSTPDEYSNVIFLEIQYSSFTNKNKYKVRKPICDLLDKQHLINLLNY